MKPSIRTRLHDASIIWARTGSPLRAASIAKLLPTPTRHTGATIGALHYHFAPRTGFPALRLGKGANFATQFVIAAFSGVCVILASRANFRAAFWA